MNNIALIDFLREKNTRTVAFKMLSSGIIDPENASDFDVFDVLCKKLYLLAANPLRERFVRLLCEASGDEIKPIMLYDCEYRKMLWQKIFSLDDIALPKVESNPLEAVECRWEARSICLNSLIDYSFENIRDLLKNTLDKIKAEQANECFFDATEIIYARPDDFHAQEEYEKLKGGGVDRSLTSLWLLCRVLMNTSLSLRLRVDSQKKAEDILSLIFRLGSSPKTVISYDASLMTDYAKTYCYLTDNYKKNISLELDFSKENSGYVLDFLSDIPLAFVEKINVRSKTVRNALSGRAEEGEIALIISYLNTVK